MSFQGFLVVSLMISWISLCAAYRPLRIVRLRSLAIVLATSGVNVAPSIAPERSAATRACSSGRTFNVSSSIYGRSLFQKSGLRV